MAKYGSDSIGFFLVDGFNMLASKVFDISGPEVEAVLENSHGLGDAWEESLGVGLQRGTLTQNGLYDDADAGVNAALCEQEQARRVICLSFQGNAIGKKFTGMAGAFAGKFKRAAQRTGLLKAAADYTITGAIEEGVILQALATKTASWNTEGADSVDAGASSADGGAGYLQVGDVDTLTSLNVTVEHSADDVTYAELLAFTQVVAANQAERVAVSGTVNRHLAIDATLVGTSVQVMAGFARV